MIAKRIAVAMARPVQRVAACVIVTIGIAAFLGAWIAPYDPVAIDVASRLLPPSSRHWLGTDQFGRDLLSRMLMGASISLRVSAFVALAATVAGASIGLIAGYFGGWIDRILASLIDAMLALPGILLALALVAVVGASETGVLIALSLAFTPNVARVARALALALRSRPYVEVSRGLGRSHLHVLARHIVPNLAGPIVVLGTAYFASALLAESALSFLGLGVPPPYPSWGGLLAEGQSVFTDAPWLTIFPGAAIMVTLLSVNLLGDGLRDVLDPRDELRR